MLKSILSRFCLFVLVVTIWSIKCRGQIKPVAYLFPDSIAGDHQLQSRPSSRAEHYSFIGLHQKALATYELDREIRINAGEGVVLSEKEAKKRMKAYRLHDALTYILHRSADYQVVILNEAHHKVQHRVFAQSLLPGLYQQGFRYLGLEALTPSFVDSTAYMYDTTLNDRGYPLNSPATGHYSREPQFGNFIRSAIAQGYEVFGHERNDWQHDMLRDSAQALNVLRFLEDRPRGKVLLYVGYAHANAATTDPERNYGRAKWLAGYIRDLTGITPLTINQEMLTERAREANDPRYSLFQPRRSSVLLDKQGKALGGTVDHPGKFDILVIHPATRWRKGRPHWLYRQGAYSSYRVKLKGTEREFPLLVQAFRQGEDTAAVPVDQLWVPMGQKRVNLVLPAGAYRLVVRSAQGVLREATFVH